MWVFEPALAVAVSKLSKLGNAAARIKGSVRYRVAAQYYQSLSLFEFHFNTNAAILQAAESGLLAYAPFSHDR